MNGAFAQFGIDKVQLTDVSASTVAAKMREDVDGSRSHIWLSHGKFPKRLLVAQRYMYEKSEEYWVEYWDQSKTHLHIDTPFTWDELVDFFSEAAVDAEATVSRYPRTRHKHSMFGLDPLTTLWPAIVTIGVSTAAIFVPPVSRGLAVVSALLVLLNEILGPKRQTARSLRAKTRRLQMGIVRSTLRLGMWMVAGALALFGASMSFPAVPGIVWKAISVFIFCLGIITTGPYVFHSFDRPRFAYPVPLSSHDSERDSKGKVKVGRILKPIPAFLFVASVALWVVVPAVGR